MNKLGNNERRMHTTHEVGAVDERIRRSVCKTRENSNFLKNGKTVISVKTRNFSISRMTKRTSPLESSREI